MNNHNGNGNNNNNDIENGNNNGDYNTIDTSEDDLMPISFTDLTIFLKSQKKTILKGISGDALPGNLLAVMGGTGAGKTSLLAFLAHRLDSNLEYSGKVRYGGLKYSKSLRKYLAFVQQDDIVVQQLTVREHIKFCARLRLGGASNEDVNKRIEEVISALHLEKCAESVIGGPAARGISGGERKRTCIAVELLTKPRVLFLDEATTGLDSATSKVMVGYVQKLAQKSKITVIATIHQPSSQLFFMFDNLLVLHQGEKIYHGETKQLVPWFEECGYIVPQHYNPADFLLDVLIDGNFENDKKFSDHVEKTRHQFRKTTALALDGDSHGPADKNMKGSTYSFRHLGIDSVLHESVKERYAVGWFSQVGIIFSRMKHIYWYGFFTKESIITNVGLIILASFQYWQLSWTEEDIWTRISLIFWMLGTKMYLSLFNYLFSFQDDGVQLKKDLEDGAYRLSSYYVAKSLIFLPLPLFWVFFYSLIVMLLSNLVSNAASGVVVIVLLMLLSICFQGLGILLSISFTGPNVVSAGILLATFSFGFAGLLAPISSLPIWLVWTQWVDVLAWALQMLQLVVFSPTTTFACSSGATASTFPSCQNQAEGAIITSADIFEVYGVNRGIWDSILFILGVIIVTRLSAYLILRRSWNNKLGKKVVVNEGESPSS